MSKKELKRLKYLHLAQGKSTTLKDASSLMNVGYRQAKRIIKKVRGEGGSAIIHKSRGKHSNRSFGDEVIENIIDIYKNNYSGFGPTLVGEKLLELHQIQISTETLRKILIKKDLWKARRKTDRNIHTFRERKHHRGELVQIDGSHHRWLEGRLDQEFCFMGYIDDATGEIFGKFYEYEGIYPYLDSFKEFSKVYGFPKAVYVDRHSTYKTTRKPTIEEQLKGSYAADTQALNVMQDIGVEVIQTFKSSSQR